MKPRALLDRAAAIIEREAEGIRAAHGTFGRWDDCKEAKRDHDEMLRIAAQLRQAEAFDAA
ncbi:MULTISPECIES: hypothetical protein [Caballeronia]|uniref:hypothetical protein n=1 Tax=Caballeronia TaxID=1827195 RepID=UPI002028B201|nr:MULTISPECIES: hypothetical protein [unclassified Caballeronia]MDR5797207.1 hypothetical protein [Caballeronia sp. LZ008]